MKRTPIVALMLLAALAGYGQSDRRIVVGTVSFDGKHAEWGEIRLIPERGGPLMLTKLGPGGRYRLEASDGGVAFGPSRVEIKLWRDSKTKRAVQPPDFVDSLLPPRISPSSTHRRSTTA